MHFIIYIEPRKWALQACAAERAHISMFGRLQEKINDLAAGKTTLTKIKFKSYASDDGLGALD
jgi:hypothetical protein